MDTLHMLLPYTDQSSSISAKGICLAVCAHASITLYGTSEQSHLWLYTLI